jgi:DNA-directed RNA polymerase I, II, and III subunit RPABC5|tara:strand:+ start:263 stop:496 length:234 start_codon:yes stop_codon:yes gene_type:complete
MIIPIKCFTCGKVLADKYLFYQKEVRKIKIEQNIEQNRVSYLDENNYKKTPEGIVLDNIKLTKICCRRHMLTHVDIE